MPADPPLGRYVLDQVLAVVEVITVERIALEPRRHRIERRRPVRNHHVD